MEHIDLKAQNLAKRIGAFRKALAFPNKNIREDQAVYDPDEI